MNVGLVVYGSLDARSGGYRYDRELVRRLRARGATVSLFTQPQRPYPFRFVDNLDREFARRIQRANLDVLLEDELNHPSLLTMGRRANLPTRVSIVHHLRISERHARAQKAFYAMVECRYLDGVDGFICNSATTASVVRENSPRPRPLVVARPGGREMLQPPSSEELLGKAARPPFRILFVGQLTRRKGLATLLDAVGALPRGTWRLDVVGDAEAEPRYARRCRARAEDFGNAVRFRGHLDGEALDAAYREAHVLCVPSQYEGYGIVYAEALQYGLPAIATQDGGASEIIEEGRTGFLVPADSPSAVAAALAQLDDPKRLAAMSLEALQRGGALPTWQESMDIAVDFLMKLAGRQRRDPGMQ
jgi:glycosyltransferase involved in cell wall biosynthesis